MDVTDLRARFPVLDRVAYLNAGTDGPLSSDARDAAAAELDRELRDGRAKAHFERRTELTDALRAAYAGAGQKWCCGPDGTGMLYVTAELRERLAVFRRGYGNLADPGEGLDAHLHDDARCLDTLSLSAETVACALAAVELLASAGWTTVHDRALTLAARLAGLLAERGREPAPRGPSTLVSFASADPEAERDLLAGAGVILRNIPDRPWLRASVGAWNDDNALDRLLDCLPV